MPVRVTALPTAKVEQEIQELQRRFRMLENDKRSFTEDAQAALRKQRVAIEKLSRENRKMKEDLELSRQPSLSSSKSLQERTHAVQERIEQYESRLLSETERRLSLESQMSDMTASCGSLRLQLQERGGALMTKEEQAISQKTVALLEDRLHTALQRYNETVGSNRSTRSQIDLLRKEKEVFESVRGKMESELSVRKREMSNVIEQANAAFAARDLAQSQMHSLKALADKEHAEFEKEWKELGRLIDNDKKMKAFLHEKERKRLEDVAKENQLKEEAEKKRTAEIVAAQLQALEGPSKQIAAKLAQYESAFHRLQAATGLADIEALVKSFKDAEHRNFSLFRFANTLTAEFGKISAKHAEFSEELAQEKIRHESEQQTGNLVSCLENRVKIAESNAEKLVESCSHTQESINRLTIGIRRMLNQDGEVMEILAIIETQALSYISAFLSRSLSSAKLPPRVLPKLQPLTGSLLKLPSTVEGDSSDEENEIKDQVVNVQTLKNKANIKFTNKNLFRKRRN